YPPLSNMVRSNTGHHARRLISRAHETGARPTQSLRDNTRIRKGQIFFKGADGGFVRRIAPPSGPKITAMPRDRADLKSQVFRRLTRLPEDWSYQERMRSMRRRKDRRIPCKDPSRARVA